MKIKAAVVLEKGHDYKIMDVNLAEPSDNDVLVKIVASGICRSDYGERNGNSINFPNVLGHEGAGIVEKVGKSVSTVKVGDHVILSYGYCQKCEGCSEGHPSSCDHWMDINNSGTNARHEFVLTKEDGEPINNFFNQSAFATYSLVDESNIVKVDKDIDLRLLGPLGCGIGTGSGAVMSVLKPKAGDSIAVFGTGAVGFAALMAAKIVGCRDIIAIDINEERLAEARELGATYTINSKDPSVDVTALIRNHLNGKGVSFTIDTTGYLPIMKTAVSVLKSGGTFAPLAVTKNNFEINTFFDLVFGNKKMVGCLIGDTIPKFHLNNLIDFYKEGLFPFDRFVKYYDFADIQIAEKDSVEGKTIKSVVVMDKTYQPPTV